MRLPLLGILKTCPGCGATFPCGAETGECWCAKLPPILPVPTDMQTGCLCPTCLGEQIAGTPGPASAPPKVLDVLPVSSPASGT